MLADIALRSFVLVQANWPAGKVRRLIARLQPSHLIVQQTDESEDSYYLLRVPDVEALLAQAEEQTPVHAALELAQREPTPALDAFDDELGAPPQAVVLDEERLIGFVERSEPAPVPAPPDTTSRRVEVLSGAWEPEPASRGVEVLSGTLEPESANVSRSLVADFPAQVVLGETRSLLVFLSTDMLAGQLALTLALGTTIDVVVRPRRGFAVIGNDEGSLTVTGEAETAPLQFKLEATSAGLGIIQIYVFEQGQSLGRVTLQPRVVTGSEAKVSASIRPLVQLLPAVPVIAPDLSLIIREQREPERGDVCLTFTLKTYTACDPPAQERRFGPVPLRVDPQHYFREFFTGIERLAQADEAEWRLAEDQLAHKGEGLYQDLIPEELQEILWTLRERLHSVQLQSDEPWIPWELCKLRGRENDRLVPGPFFCEAFAVTRWLPKISNKLALSLRNIALVVPADSGLAQAAGECAFISSLASNGRQVQRVSASHLEVITALAAGTYDGWHFICHGELPGDNPEQARLVLEGDEELTPADLSGTTENLGLAAPLIFLNACKSGQSGLALTGLGGWAERFLSAAYGTKYPQYGAAAFIGTYWSINDAAALAFTQAFYTALLVDHKTIGEAVHAARLAVKALGGLTWLAYTVFAHPLARVEEDRAVALEQSPT